MGGRSRRISWKQPEGDKEPSYTWRNGSFLLGRVQAALAQFNKVSLTKRLNNIFDNWRGTRWGGEEISYLLLSGVSLALFLTSYLPVTLAWLWVLGVLSAVKILDAVLYEIKVIFYDHKPELEVWGHILSAHRRVMLVMIRVFDIVLAFATVYWVVSHVRHDAFLTKDNGVTATSPAFEPMEALYQSFSVLSFAPPYEPRSTEGFLVVLAELAAVLVMLVVVLATFVSALPRLTEISPRPLRAGRGEKEGPLVRVVLQIRPNGIRAIAPALRLYAEFKSAERALETAHEWLNQCQAEDRDEDRVGEEVRKLLDDSHDIHVIHLPRDAPSVPR